MKTSKRENSKWINEAFSAILSKKAERSAKMRERIRKFFARVKNRMKEIQIANSKVATVNRDVIIKAEKMLENKEDRTCP